MWLLEVPVLLAGPELQGAGHVPRGPGGPRLQVTVSMWPGLMEELSPTFTLQEIRHRGLDALQAGGLLGRDLLVLQLYRLSGEHEYVMLVTMRVLW